MNKHLFRAARFREKGFSLIELSVAISVVASATVGFLAWTQPTSSTNAQNAAVTQTQLQEIQKAVENFRVLKKRLPCPADPLMRSDSTRAVGDNYDNPTSTTNGCSGPPGQPYDCYLNGFGMEDLYNTSTISGTGPTNGVKSGVVTNIVPGTTCPSSVGSVPVFALGLDESYMTDGWGRRFTYHVSPALCGTNGTGCTAADYQNKSGNLTVVAGGTTTTNAAYVVVSHGANGYGAFLPSGAKLTQSSDANEAKNSTGSATANYVKADKSTTFDDLVVFETKNQIESMTNRKNAKNISIEDCQANSTAIKNLTLTETGSMNTNYTGQQQMDGDGATQNSGDDAMLSVLWSVQSICIAYYGTAATTINGQTWGGAQCPGNNAANVLANGSTYDAATNSCTCYSGLWDGNCTLTAPWVPTSVAGLKLWLDPTDSAYVYSNSNCTTAGTPADGGPVGCWKDKSGLVTPNNVSQAGGSKPTYNTSTGINGYPSITFSNAQYLYNNTSYTNTGATISGFVVFRPTSIDICDGFVALLGSGRSRDYMYIEGMIPTQMCSATDIGIVRTWTQIADIAGITLINTSKIYDFIFDGSIATIRIYPDNLSNASTSTANTTSNFNINQVIVGGRYDVDGGGYANFFTGSIGDVIIYNASLSSTDRVKAERYLGTKWGISVP